MNNLWDFYILLTQSTHYTSNPKNVRFFSFPKKIQITFSQLKEQNTKATKLLSSLPITPRSIHLKPPHDRNKAVRENKVRCTINL